MIPLFKSQFTLHTRERLVNGRWETIGRYWLTSGILGYTDINTAQQGLLKRTSKLHSTPYRNGVEFIESKPDCTIRHRIWFDDMVCLTRRSK